MTSQLFSIGAILFSTALFLTGNGLLGTLTPLRAHNLAFSDFEIGMMGSCYFLGFVAGCLTGPKLLARVGHIRTFGVAAASNAAAVLMFPLITAPIIWFCLRALTGLFIAWLFTSLESWLNDRATNESRGRLLSTYVVVNLSGLIVGQWLLLAAPADGPIIFNVCAIFFSLCLLPVSLTTLPQPQPAPLPRIEIRRLFEISPVGAVGCVAVGLANAAFWALAPVYAQSRGFTTHELALFMTMFIAGGALVQWPLGRFSDRTDRRWIIAMISVVAAVSGLLLAVVGSFLSPGAALFNILIFMQGAAMLPLYSLSIAHTNDRLPREEFIVASAGMLLISGLASIIGPLLGAIVTSAAGPNALFLYTALVHSAMAFFAFSRIRTREAPPAEARDTFVPLAPQSSPAALPLDPRGPTQ